MRTAILLPPGKADKQNLPFLSSLSWSSGFYSISLLYYSFSYVFPVATRDVIYLEILALLSLQT